MDQFKQISLRDANDESELNPGIIADGSETVIPDANVSGMSWLMDASGEYSQASSFKEWVKAKTIRSQNQAHGLAAALSAEGIQARKQAYLECAQDNGDAIALSNVTVQVDYPEELIEKVIAFPDVSSEEYAYIESVRNDIIKTGYDISTLSTDGAFEGLVTLNIPSGNTVVNVNDVIAVMDQEQSSLEEYEAVVNAFVSNRLTGAASQARVSLDNISDGLSKSVQSSQAIQTMAESIYEDLVKATDEGGFVSRFMDNVTTKCLTTSDVAMSLIDAVRSDIQDPGLSVKEKIKSVMHTCGLTTDSVERTNVLEPFESGFSGMTGASPIALFGDQIVDRFLSIDWSTIGSGIKGVWDATCKTVGAAFAGIGNGIGKLCKKIKSSTVAAEDIIIVDKKADPVINNIGWNFKMRDDLYNYFKDYVSDTEYTIFSAPTAKIYLWKNDNEIRGMVKFSCAYDGGLTVPDFWESTLANTSDMWSNTYLSKCAQWYENNYTEKSDPDSDSHALDAMHSSKLDFIAWGTMVILLSHSPLLAATFYSTGRTAEQVCAQMEQTLNADYSAVPTMIFDSSNVNLYGSISNPTNAQLASEASYFGSQASSTPHIASAIGKDPNTGKYTLDTFICCLVDSLLRYAKSDWKYRVQPYMIELDFGPYNVVPYVSYYHSNSSLDGRYAIKTDSSNAKSYANLLAAFVITSVAVLVGTILIKRRLTAKKRAFSLERMINSDKYHVEEALSGNEKDMAVWFGAAGITNVHVDEITGKPDDPKQINKMLAYARKGIKKKERKLDRLNKLMGVSPTTSAVSLIKNKMEQSGQSQDLSLTSILYVLNGERLY